MNFAEEKGRSLATSANSNSCAGVIARLLPTTALETGDYEIKVLTKDRVGGQVIENKGKFTIVQ